MQRVNGIPADTRRQQMFKFSPDPTSAAVLFMCETVQMSLLTKAFTRC